MTPRTGRLLFVAGLLINAGCALLPGGLTNFNYFSGGMIAGMWIACEIWQHATRC